MRNVSLLFPQCTLQQIPHSQRPGPVPQLGGVQRRPMGLDHPQHVTPVALRHPPPRRNHSGLARMMSSALSTHCVSSASAPTNRPMRRAGCCRSNGRGPAAGWRCRFRGIWGRVFRYEIQTMRSVLYCPTCRHPRRQIPPPQRPGLNHHRLTRPPNPARTPRPPAPAPAPAADRPNGGAVPRVMRRDGDSAGRIPRTQGRMERR